jgi:nicotinate-nucleotide adenylyltransferase
MIGILGGTFDPIHNGHLRLAREALAQLHLTEVRIIPTGQPAHRDAPVASIADRLEMTSLAVAYKPGLVLDDREIRRQGVCYTVDTLTELRAELGTEMGLCLLLGADAFLGLATWHDWRRLFDLAHIVIALRPGNLLDSTMMDAELTAQWQQRKVIQLPEAPAGSIMEFAMTPMDISASRIREFLSREQSVQGMLPYTVLNYIFQQHLYQNPSERTA